MNADGLTPFTNNNDFTTANAAFFDRLAHVIQEAADRNILVLVTPSYIGYGCGDEGWCQEMFANGTQKLNQYGQFLGNRLRNLPNIIWVEGGDHTPSTTGTPSEWDLVNAVATGIETGDGGVHLHTAHWSRGTSSSEGPSAAWLDVDGTYTGLGLQTFRDSSSDWGRDKGVRPSFLIESLYEYSVSSGITAVGSVLRAQMYQPLLLGSFGFLFGNVPICFFGNVGDGNPGWAFPTSISVGNWKTQLGSPGARYASRAKQLFSSLPWQALVPDTAHAILKSGYSDANADHSVLLAATPDRHLAVSYFTASMTVTIDMSQFAGSVAASFYDPISGASQLATGSPFANSGTHSFTPPSKNSEGAADWVLLLQVN
jgi:hypothetical protein